MKSRAQEVVDLLNQYVAPEWDPKGPHIWAEIEQLPDYDGSEAALARWDESLPSSSFALTDGSVIAYDFDEACWYLLDEAP
jgi:hypothetical protein